MKGLSLKRWRDIRRQRWQFAAVLVTVILGVLMFAASYDAYRNLNASYQGTYDRLAFADMTVIGGGSGLETALKALDGVATVITRVQADVPLKVGDKVFVGRVVSVPPGVQPEVGKLDVVRGEYLPPAPAGKAAAAGAATSADTTAGNAALVETHMAKDFSVAPGDAVSMLTPEGWRRLEIVGEVVSPEYLWPARSNQQFFEPPGQFGVLFVPPSVTAAVDPTLTVDQTLILYEHGADAAALDAAVRRTALDNGAGDAVAKADQASNKGLSLDVMGFGQMALFFPAMFLLVAGLAAYMLLTRLVYSQRSQIGTLRANGFSRAAVLRHYLSYGLWLGLTGAVVGTALGVPAGWAMTAAYTQQLGIPDTVRELHWVTPVVGVGFGIVVGLVSAWVPARAAVRLRPADALRGEAGTRTGGISLLERILPPLRRTPVHWRMVIRGIGRSKRRSLSVVVGITLALVLVLAAWGMVDTVTILLDRQFNQVDIADAIIATTAPVDAAFVGTVAAVPGVEAAEPVAAAEVNVRGPAGTYSTTAFAFLADTTVHGFATAGGRLPQNGALVGAALSDKVGVKVGDTINLSLPGLGGGGFDVVVRGFVDEAMGTPVYVSRQTLEIALAGSGIPGAEAVLEQPGVALVYARFAPDADREATLTSLRALTGVAAVTDARSIYVMVKDYMGLFYIFVGLMLVFGGVMALALIFNIVSVNLAERVGELATMRANGVSRRRLGVIVLAENMILTALGIVPGLLVGYGAAAWLMASYTSDMLDFGIRMRPTTVIFSALGMFVVTAVSLWPGMRAVGRLDIATEVRERSQ